MATGGRNHNHHFDPVSGWCHYCNLREDGRLVGKGGDVFNKGRGYSIEETSQIQQRQEGTRS